MILGLLCLLIAPFALLHVLARMFLAPGPPLPGAVQRVDVQPDGATLVSYWHEVEHPGATLIFVHGTPATADAFHAQMNFAFPDADLVAYDRPGFGRSPGGVAQANLGYQSAALCKLVAQARTPGVILVGHSYGGPVVLEAAAMLPHRVTGVVTIGGSVSSQEEHPWAIQYVGAWPWVAALLPGAVRSSNQELLTLKSDLVRLDGRLRDVRCPVLMLQGDHDAQVPARNMAYLRARFADLGKSSQLQTRLFTGYNHFMMWEHPAEINAALADFVQQCEASPEETGPPGT